MKNNLENVFLRGNGKYYSVIVDNWKKFNYDGDYDIKLIAKNLTPTQALRLKRVLSGKSKITMVDLAIKYAKSE